jgi:hypothetical protein
MTQAQALPAQATAEPAERIPAKRSGLLLVPAFAALTLLAVLVSRRELYTPGSDFGYYMGVVGGIMMLTLLLYPLRKHLRFMQVLGGMRHWFRVHMLFGIIGPLLILFHSTFTIGSLNAGVALACMLLVAGSGVVGRFMYTRIHHGLYGRRATVQELQTQLGMHEGEVRSKFHFAPSVESRLKAYGELAHRHPPGLAGAWQFLTLAPRARYVHLQCLREVKQILREHGARRGWERDKLRRRLGAASEMMAAYLKAARHAAQFGAYEQLFSLWHVLHVPFVFMLAISGMVHVIAVHMY